MAKPGPDTMDGVNPATGERPMAGDGMTRPEGGRVAPPGKTEQKHPGTAAEADKLPPPPSGDLSM